MEEAGVCIMCGVILETMEEIDNCLCSLCDDRQMHRLMNYTDEDLGQYEGGFYNGKKDAK